MSKLDILVPRHNESTEICRYLLDSIALQQGISFDDIRVIISDDGSDEPLPEPFLQSFPYKIIYRKHPNHGVSWTRNDALDASDAELVMFCDIDDMFYSVLGVWSIFKIYEVKPFEVFVPIFVEEQVKDGRHIYIDHQNTDAVFVHGKVFLRQFLIDKGVRFKPELTIHEDSYFVRMALRSTQKTFRSDASFYMWKWREESVCRSDPQYLLKTFPNLMATQFALTEEYIKHKWEDVRELVVSNCYMVYYTLNQAEWIAKENRPFREKAEQTFKKYLKKYGKLGVGIDPAKQMEISQTHRSAAIQRGMIQETMSFGAWMKSMS